MKTTSDTSGHLRLAASGGEVVLDGPLFPVEPAPLSARELIDAESRLLARATGEHSYGCCDAVSSLPLLALMDAPA